MDTRYPNLKPLEQLPIDPAAKARFISACDEIRRRTGVLCCYNAVSRCLFFYLRDPSQGIVLPWEKTHVPILHDVDIEYIVREIYEARRPMKQKLERCERSIREAERAADEAADREMDSLEPDARDILRHMGNHCGMGSHYRSRVVVDGNKSYVERPSGLLVAQGAYE